MNNELYAVYVNIIKQYQEFMATYRSLDDRSAARFFFMRIKALRIKLNQLETL